MIHTIQNEALCVQIAERGAEMQSILHRDGTEYLWQGDARFWPDRAPTIFPYVARLTQETYSYRGKCYRLPIHGFAPTASFTRTNGGADFLELTLCPDRDTLAAYPFLFRFAVLHRLVENTLHVTYTVENRDNRTMYFGLGGHPGFCVPLEDGLRFEDYRLAFALEGTPEHVGFTKSLFLSGDNSPFRLEEGDVLPLRHSLFDEDAIVLKGTFRQVALLPSSGKKSVTVRSRDFPYLGIWHAPKTAAPYVCIEPWSSLPSRQGVIEDIEEQENLAALAPGMSRSFQWSMSFT